MNKNLNQLQSQINYQFKDKEKLTQALIHRSYLNENRKKISSSNERYEFLGDAVLELWSTKTLFHLFPNFSEGKMTNLRSLIVCTKNLEKIAQNIKLGDFIFLSHGEENNDGRKNQSIIADTLEALIGAVYLDSSIKKTFTILDSLFQPSLKQLSSKKIYKDPKSIFQELAQSQKGITPHYQTISEIGLDHKKTFKVAVFLDKEKIATGSGNSKQKAEENASTQATKILSNLV